MACAAELEPGATELEPRAEVEATSAALVSPVPIGMNIGPLAYYSPEVPFEDVFKTRDAWVPEQAGVWDSGDLELIDFDSDGYPSSGIPAGPNNDLRVAAAVFMPVYDTVFDVTWSGTGSLEFWGPSISVTDVTANALTLTVTRQLGDYVFMRIASSASGANHLTNVQIKPRKTQKSLTADFNASMSGYRVLRFMDWGHTNSIDQETWADRPTKNEAQGSSKGASIESMIEICNRFKADFWYNVPAAVNDDYVQQAAVLIRTNLDPSLKVYVEYANENWNGIFPQHQYQQTQGNTIPSLVAAGSHPNEDFWTGLKYASRRAAEVHAIFRTEFSATPTRIVAVLGGQSAFPYLNDQILAAYYDENVVGQDLAMDPTNKVDALAVAPYFGKNYDQDGYPPDYPPNITPAQAAAITPQQILAEAVGTIPQMVATETEANKVVADTYGAALIGYEGGQHITAQQSLMEDVSFTDKLNEANRLPGMADAYNQAHSAWVANGGGLIVYFNSVQPYSKFGSWGAREYQDQPLWQAPKAAALHHLRTADRKVTLRTRSNERFVTAENFGNSPILNRAEVVGAWEKFILVANLDGTVSLKADINGKFLSAGSGGGQSLIANQTSIGESEKFHLARTDDGFHALRSIVNNQWVTFDANGSIEASARAASLGDSEKLTILDVAPAGFSIPDGEASMLRKRTSAMCLDVPQSTMTSGQQLQTFQCNFTGAQSFQLIKKANALYEIRRTNTNLCLDVRFANYNEGTVIQQYTCNNTNAQRFAAEPRNGGIQLRANQTTLCVDVPDNSSAPGTLINLRRCDHPDARVFERVPLQIKKLHTGANICIDTPGGSLASGQRLQMYGCNATGAQNWQLNDKSGGGGPWEIRRNTSGLCMAVSGTAQPGAHLVQATCDGSTAQTWHREIANGGRQLRSASGTNLCIDILNNSDAQGTLMQVYTCNGSNAQIWAL